MPDEILVRLTNRFERAESGTEGCGLGLLADWQTAGEPDGIYATIAESYWLEVKDGDVAYLGTSEPLYQSADGYAVSLSTHLPMRLKWTGEVVEGEVGHLEHSFLPVTTDLGCLKQVQGIWYHPQYRTAFEIRGNKIHIGVGPAAQVGTLSSLGNGRMLVESQDGPWLKRFCLYFRG